MSAMNFSDRVPVRGNLEILYMKGDYPVIIGSDIIIDPNKTQVVYKETGHNLVVDEGRLVLNQTMAGELPAGLSADPITYFCTPSNCRFACSQSQYTLIWIWCKSSIMSHLITIKKYFSIHILSVW